MNSTLHIYNKNSHKNDQNLATIQIPNSWRIMNYLHSFWDFIILPLKIKKCIIDDWVKYKQNSK